MRIHINDRQPYLRARCNVFWRRHPQSFARWFFGVFVWLALLSPSLGISAAHARNDAQQNWPGWYGRAAWLDAGRLVSSCPWRWRRGESECSTSKIRSFFCICGMGQKGQECSDARNSTGFRHPSFLADSGPLPLFIYCAAQGAVLFGISSGIATPRTPATVCRTFCSWRLHASGRMCSVTVICVCIGSARAERPRVSQLRFGGSFSSRTSYACGCMFIL